MKIHRIYISCSAVELIAQVWTYFTKAQWFLLSQLIPKSSAVSLENEFRCVLKSRPQRMASIKRYHLYILAVSDNIRNSDFAAGLIAREMSFGIYVCITIFQIDSIANCGTAVLTDIKFHACCQHDRNKDYTLR